MHSKELIQFLESHYPDWKKLDNVHIMNAIDQFMTVGFSQLTNEQNEIGVVYRPEYGMPWTFNTDLWKRTYKPLVQAVIDKNWTEVERIVKEKYPDQYHGTYESLKVIFVPRGSLVEFDTYDGKESYNVKSTDEYLVI